MTIQVLNGANLGRLGKREPAEYGTTTYAELVELIERAAGELGVQAGRLTRAEADRHRDLIAAMGLPTSYRGDWAALQAVMRLDKKARGATLRFVVLDGIGNPGILTDPDQAWLDAAWAAASEAA